MTIESTILTETLGEYLVLFELLLIHRGLGLLQGNLDVTGCYHWNLKLVARDLSQSC